MKISIQFQEDSEIQEILEANLDKAPVECQHHLDGNFLVFETEPTAAQAYFKLIGEIKTIKDDIAIIKSK